MSRLLVDSRRQLSRQGSISSRRNHILLGSRSLREGGCNLTVRVLIFGCTLTAITLERRELEDLALVSLSLSIKA
jgi:hypothetical protein